MKAYKSKSYMPWGKYIFCICGHINKQVINNVQQNFFAVKNFNPHQLGAIVSVDTRLI